MPNLSWLGQEAALSPAALTVLAQAVPVNDDGTGGDTLYDIFFPRQTVGSVKLNSITSLDYRPVADRREWNQRGRLVPVVIGPLREIEMVPVESYFKIDEYEMQRLYEQTGGNQALLRSAIMASIPDRTRMLAYSNNARLAVDAFTAWALGQTTARDPQGGATQTVSYGFSATRYTTAGTAWNVVANAYTAFIAWLLAARDLVGAFEGVMLRQATLNEITLDAPVSFGFPAGTAPTQTEVERRVQDQLGTAFRFFVNENSVDVFTGAGTSYTRTKLWPTGKVAIVPAGRRVGNMAYAPNARAGDVATGAPNARIDVNGMAVYVDVTNGGREVAYECQVNAFPIPNEQKLAVIDALV